MLKVSGLDRFSDYYSSVPAGFTVLNLPRSVKYLSKWMGALRKCTIQSILNLWFTRYKVPIILV